MTLKQLTTEYRETDSVSARANLKDQIVEICADFAKRRHIIAEKYKQHKTYEISSDYRPERGHWELDEDYDVGEKEARLIYTDYWRYGGYCRDSYDFNIEEVDSFNEEDFTKKCLAAQKKDKTNEITRRKREIEKLQKELAELENSWN